MLRIAFSTLGDRKSGMFGAFAAVGLAVVLVVSCGVLLESSLRAPIPVQRLQAAAVIVEGDPAMEAAGGTSYVDALLTERRRIAESVVERIATVPGVRQAIGDRSVYAQVLGRNNRLLRGDNGGASAGHGWSSAVLTPYTLVSGHAPLSPGEVVLDAVLASDGALEPGDRVRILTATAPEVFVVSGIAAAAGSLSGALFFRDDVAARLSGAGRRVDLIGVVVAPGVDPRIVADRISRALDEPTLRVLTGAKRGEAESPDEALSREDVVAGLTVFGLLAALVALFVVMSTFALSVRQRHRELALFRAIGATPRQVRSMVAGEALLVSLAAFGFAAPLGVLTAHLEEGLFSSAGLIPQDLRLTTGWLPLGAGLVAAIVTTQLAALASARRAARIRPTDALREATVRGRAISWRRALAGLALLAGGIATVAVLSQSRGSSGQSDAPVAVILLMIAAALLGPLLALPFASLLGRPLAIVSRGPGMLAHANTRANLARVASIATPLMLAVALICTISFGKSALQREITVQSAGRMTAGYVLQGRSAPGLPMDLAAAARRVPGVIQASGSIGTSAVVITEDGNLQSVAARGIDAAALDGVLDLGLVTGSLDDLHGAALAVGVARAKALGWHTGDRVKLWLGDGAPVTLRVAATFTRPLGFGDIVLPKTLVRGHVTQPLDDAVYVSSDPTADQPTVLAALERLTEAEPTVMVLTSARYREQLESAAKKQSREVYLLLAVIGTFCAMALVNALAMATTERAREFALLRLIGASRRQIRRMVRAETLITVVFGLTIGSILAAPGLAAFNYSLTGAVVPPVPVVAYGALLGAYGLIGFAGTALATRLALRTSPIGATAARD